MDFGTGLAQALNARMVDGLAGTPLYLAPELFGGAKPTVASDIYSLGVLLYHLASERYPVEGSDPRRGRAGARGRRRSLRDDRPELPTAFVDVVERALSTNPGARYATAGDFGSALAATTGLPSDVQRLIPQSTDLRSLNPNFNRRRWLLRAAGLFGTAVAGGVAWRFLGGSASDEAPAVRTSNTTAVAPPVAAASYQVAASLHALRDGRNVRLSAGSRVQPGDKLFLTVEASRDVFVYVVNQDDAGAMFVLFPLSGHQPGNPIARGGSHRLPGKNSDGEESYWVVTSAGGRERFSVFITPERQTTFEQILDRMPRAAEGRAVEYVPVSIDDLKTLRGVGGVASGPSPSGATTLDAPFGGLAPLPDGPESTSGLWEREIVLLNP